MKTRLGIGARAVVYKEDGFAWKLFLPDTRTSTVLHEAYLTSLVGETSLLVPRVYQVGERGGRLGICMDCCPGEDLHRLVAEDHSKTKDCISLLVTLQLEIEGAKAVLSDSWKQILKNRLGSMGRWSPAVRNGLVKLLHRDFHGGNVLWDGHRAFLIDWATACMGWKGADACRTYLIYLLHAPELADVYLQCYCEKSGMDRGRVLEFLPLMAAARLVEGIEDEERFLEELTRKTLAP